MNVLPRCLVVIVMVVWSARATSTLADDPVRVVVHADRRGQNISPYVYGQFIEHLGRCIYGGIWAEMLEDRKFYFPITAEYEPYKSLQNTRFPVVGASPWQIIGPVDSVQMAADCPLAGEHAPQIAAGGGIRQRDLGVVEGKKYVGYLWLKSDSGETAAVDVALVCGAEDGPRQVRRMEDVGREYAKYPFEFTADAATDEAMLEIRSAGPAAFVVGGASLMPADNVRGMRADTLALLKELGAPMYRWPGGNFVSGYDWRDGIGDRDRRPPRKNPAWTGVEHNDVGVDEFILFCREVGAEPLITVNTGFGDDYSAAQEVEYCNGSTDTIGGGWRAKNGRSEPHAVKYWCVGNEMYGDWQLGHMKLDHYVQKHNRVANAMLKADPSIKLIGVGDLGNGADGWSAGMLRECRRRMDYVSEHFYRGRNPWGEQTPADVSQHAAMLKDEIRKKAEGHRRLQKELGLLPGATVPIAMDEWNYWHQDYHYGELGCSYDLADALGVAAALHEYFRNSDIIRMAHYAQTVNVIGCIKTTKTGAFFDATAWPLMLYRKHFGQTPLAVSYRTEKAGVDVVAAATEDGQTLTLAVVNPFGAAVRVAFDLPGLTPGSPAQEWIVGGGNNPRVTNDVDQQRVRAVERSIDFAGDWEIPRFSFGILRVPL